MFYKQPLFNQDISGWDTSSVVNMSSAFWGASAFDQPIGLWDVSQVTSMAFTLREATVFNQDLNGWDISKVTSLRSHLFKAYLFDQDISSWNIVKVSNLASFLGSVTLSTVNYDLLLVGWEATLQAAFPEGVGYTLIPSIDFGLSKYTGGGVSEAARTSLINNFNWTVTDGGIV